MPKVIKFIELTLTNFTSIRELTLPYADITKLSGQNGAGKTSIGTAPAWIFYGTDLLGKTFNPSPTNYEFDRVFASLYFQMDDTKILLAREIDNGTNKFYHNEVPIKAKEYDALVASMFDKEMFLSLYNPSYFFTQHKDKQRDMLMRYVASPASSEVFKEMSDTESEPLKELFKKHDIEKAKTLHTKIKNENDRLHVQSQGSVKTLTEQLKELGTPEKIDLEATEINVKELQVKIDSFDADRKKVTDRETEIRNKQNQIDNLTIRIDNGKEIYFKAKADLERFNAEVVDVNCNSCGQELTLEAVEKVKQTRLDLSKSKEQMSKDQASNINPLINERKALREELAELKPLPEPEHSVTELIEQRNALEKKIDAHHDYVMFQTRLSNAKELESKYLKTKNDSIFILDAIKSFKSKEAEIQTEKVQSLFTNLSVRLFKYVKTNDEWVSDFMIQMDGKDYVQLSFGEKIGAGLELTEILFKQSNLITPVFIDGIGEYTGKVAVYDQLITGTAVKGQKLQINGQEVA